MKNLSLVLGLVVGFAGVSLEYAGAAKKRKASKTRRLSKRRMIAIHPLCRAALFKKDVKVYDPELIGYGGELGVRFKKYKFAGKKEFYSLSFEPVYRKVHGLHDLFRVRVLVVQKVYYTQSNFREILDFCRRGQVQKLRKWHAKHMRGMAVLSGIQKSLINELARRGKFKRTANPFVQLETFQLQNELMQVLLKRATVLSETAALKLVQRDVFSRNQWLSNAITNAAPLNDYSTYEWLILVATRFASSKTPVVKAYGLRLLRHARSFIKSRQTLAGNYRSRYKEVCGLGFDYQYRHLDKTLKNKFDLMIYDIRQILFRMANGHFAYGFLGKGQNAWIQTVYVRQLNAYKFLKKALGSLEVAKRECLRRSPLLFKLEKIFNDFYFYLEVVRYLSSLPKARGKTRKAKIQLPKAESGFKTRQKRLKQIFIRVFGPNLDVFGFEFLSETAGHNRLVRGLSRNIFLAAVKNMVSYPMMRTVTFVIKWHNGFDWKNLGVSGSGNVYFQVAKRSEMHPLALRVLQELNPLLYKGIVRANLQSLQGRNSLSITVRMFPVGKFYLIVPGGQKFGFEVKWPKKKYKFYLKTVGNVSTAQVK